MHTESLVDIYKKIDVTANHNELELRKRKCIKSMYTIAIMHTHLILADIDELLEQTNPDLQEQDILVFKSRIYKIVEANMEFYRSIFQKTQVY